MSRPRVVGVVPARAGSKGLKGKNMRLIPPDDRETLPSRQVRVAREAGLLDAVYVTSDHPTILSWGRDAGGKMIARPAELAADDVPMLPVLVHAAQHIAQDGPTPDGLMLLMPSYPRRSAADVARVFWEFARDVTRPLVGLLPARSAPELLFWGRHGGLVPVAGNAVSASGRRQDRPPAYEACLFACVVPFERLRAGGRLGPNLLSDDMRGMVLDPAVTLDVDTPGDWREMALEAVEEHAPHYDDQRENNPAPPRHGAGR